MWKRGFIQLFEESFQLNEREKDTASNKYL